MAALHSASGVARRPGPLSGEKALVTGGSSGIGQAIAMAFGEAGASVVVNYRSDREGAEHAVDEIVRRGGSAYAVRADVSDEHQVEAMFEEIINRFGVIDILVNNAGLQRDACFEDMTLEDWNAVIDVNLTGQFLCARAAIHRFMRRTAPAVSLARGKILFVSSVHQEIPWACHPNYAASKGGVMMLMRSLAQEFAPQRIRINSIAPGAVQTPINRAAWETPEAYEKLLELIPYKRIGKPEDVARAALWLASDESDYVVGATLFVDGGMTLYPGFATGG